MGQPSLYEGHGQQKCLRDLQEPISSFSRGRATLSPLSEVLQKQPAAGASPPAYSPLAT